MVGEMGVVEEGEKVVVGGKEVGGKVGGGEWWVEGESVKVWGWEEGEEVWVG